MLVLDSEEARRRGLELAARVRAAVQGVWPGAELPAEGVGVSAAILTLCAATLVRLAGGPKADWDRLCEIAWRQAAVADPETPPPGPS